MMDPQTEKQDQSVSPSESSLQESEPPSHKKVPFGLALVVATLLITGILVISSYLWSFLNESPEGPLTTPVPSVQTQVP